MRLDALSGVFPFQHTLEFGHVDAKLIALFKNAFATSGDEIVEAVCEFSHPLAQLVEAKVDVGEGVGHGGRVGGGEWSAHDAGG